MAPVSRDVDVSWSTTASAICTSVSTRENFFMLRPSGTVASVNLVQISTNQIAALNVKNNARTSIHRPRAMIGQEQGLERATD